jgi:hypothetical protein
MLRMMNDMPVIVSGVQKLKIRCSFGFENQNLIELKHFHKIKNFDFRKNE